MARLKVAVLISGRGSNLHALIDACADPNFSAEIRLVVSNEPDAQGLARAKRAGIPTRVLPHKQFPDRPSFDAELRQTVIEAGDQEEATSSFLQQHARELVSVTRPRGAGESIATIKKDDTVFLVRVYAA